MKEYKMMRQRKGDKNGTETAKNLRVVNGVHSTITGVGIKTTEPQKHIYALCMLVAQRLFVHFWCYILL